MNNSLKPVEKFLPSFPTGKPSSPERSLNFKKILDSQLDCKACGYKIKDRCDIHAAAWVNFYKKYDF